MCVYVIQYVVIMWSAVCLFEIDLNLLIKWLSALLQASRFVNVIFFLYVNGWVLVNYTRISFFIYLRLLGLTSRVLMRYPVVE